MEWTLVAALVLLTIALRSYNLTEWSLSDDEFRSWRDSEFMVWKNVRIRPLYYALNHFVVMPIVGMRELGLRLIPFLAGVVAVPAIYVMCRRLNLRLVGLTTSALVAVSTWHLYWSQFARYYTLVFLFATICGLSIIGWMRERSAGWALGVIGGAVLAVLSHPSALIVIGCQIVVAAFHVQRGGPHKVGWAWLAVPGLLLAVGVLRYAPILSDWMAGRESACCHTGVPLLLSLINWMTAPLMVFAVIGMCVWSFASEDRSSGRIVATGAIVPTAIFAVLSNFGAISLSYVFASAPFYFLAAGWLAAHIAQGDAPAGMRRVLLGTTVAALMSGNLVGVASHFRDGGRLPHKEAARALDTMIEDGDRLVVAGTGYFAFYAPRLAPLELPYDSTDLKSMVEPSGKTWVLAPLMERAGYGYYERQFASIYRWLDDSCDIASEFGTPRLDFRRNFLRLYACSATP
jgi:hypothetical protein